MNPFSLQNPCDGGVKGVPGTGGTRQTASGEHGVGRGEGQRGRPGVQSTGESGREARRACPEASGTGGDGVARDGMRTGSP